MSSFWRPCGFRIGGCENWGLGSETSPGRHPGRSHLKWGWGCTQPNPAPARQPVPCPQYQGPPGSHPWGVRFGQRPQGGGRGLTSPSEFCVPCGLWKEEKNCRQGGWEVVLRLQGVGDRLETPVDHEGRRSWGRVTWGRGVQKRFRLHGTSPELSLRPPGLFQDCGTECGVTPESRTGKSLKSWGSR